VTQRAQQAAATYEPDDTAWFPGCSRRTAQCRHCGLEVGWRYEQESTAGRLSISCWIFEWRHLKERKDCIPVLEEKLPEQKVQEPKVQPEPAPAVVQTPQAEATVPAPEEPKEKAPAPEEPKATKQTKEEKNLEICRKAVDPFSVQLKQTLMRSILLESKFDQALNELKIDEETRKSIHIELRIRPGMAASQKEQLIAKHFRGKVNQLRSLGIRILRTVLQEVLPADAMAAVEAEVASNKVSPEEESEGE